MKFRYFASAVLASGLAVSLGTAQTTDDDVKVMPLSMGAVVDAGQVIKGKWNESVVDGNVIQRTSVWVTQEIHISDRFQVRAGVGGMFWYDIDDPPASFSNVRPFVTSTKFGPGISRADMEYKFGDVEEPIATLQAGFFPYKYNPDAANLGEYLLRSGAYPGYLVSGGWNLMGSGYMMQGIRLNVELLGGKVRTDFLLPVERDLPPTGNLSPSLVVAANPVRGIEIGGGISCQHCISVKPSVTSPKIKYGTNAANYGNGSGIIRRNPNFKDTLPLTDLTGSRVDNGATSPYNPMYIYDTTSFYTFRGVKVMARASVDPKAYVPMDMLGPEDLKVFGEVALLGVKDYPFYYEKKTERMPVMFGVNIPAFKVLDVLSFQMEYYNSPFPNSIENAYRFQMPTFPFVTSSPGGTVSELDPNRFDRDLPEVTRDNWKWSLLAKKTVASSVTLFAQFGNDNQRMPNWKAQQSYTPVTNIQNKDWYYLVRLEMGI